LERVAQAIYAHPNVGLFYSRIEYVRETGAKLWVPNIRDVRDNGYWVLFLEGNFVAMSAAVVRKACFDQVGVFDTAIGCEDWDMWIRIARFFPIRMIDAALVVIEHLPSDSRSSYQYWVSVHDNVLDKAFRANPRIGEAFQRRARAGVAYTKGRIYLWAGDDASALQEFQRSVALNWANWRALVYLALLSFPWLRRKLPRSISRTLRLPEAYR
jgi:hypothetical protein